MDFDLESVFDLPSSAGTSSSSSSPASSPSPSSYYSPITLPSFLCLPPCPFFLPSFFLSLFLFILYPSPFSPRLCSSHLSWPSSSHSPLLFLLFSSSLLILLLLSPPSLSHLFLTLLVLLFLILFPSLILLLCFSLHLPYLLSLHNLFFLLFITSFIHLYSFSLAFLPRAHAFLFFAFVSSQLLPPVFILPLSQPVSVTSVIFLSSFIVPLFTVLHFPDFFSCPHPSFFRTFVPFFLFPFFLHLCQSFLPASFSFLLGEYSSQCAHQIFLLLFRIFLFLFFCLFCLPLILFTCLSVSSLTPPSLYHLFTSSPPPHPSPLHLLCSSFFEYFLFPPSLFLFCFLQSVSTVWASPWI